MGCANSFELFDESVDVLESWSFFGTGNGALSSSLSRRRFFANGEGVVVVAERKCSLFNQPVTLYINK